MRGTLPTVFGLIGLLSAPVFGQVCAWRHWATDWSDKLESNFGPEGPVPGQYPSPNYDYTMTEYGASNDLWNVDLNPTPLPDGGTNAFRWYLGRPKSKFPPLCDDSGGNGGLYQTITVEPGVPLEYSVWLTAKWRDGLYWYEVLLLDGEFNIYNADIFSESANMMNNPYKVRSRQFTGAGALAWTEFTHLQPPDVGPFGDRPVTLTPAGTTVTIVLKGAHLPFSGACGDFSSYWDQIEVRQNGGPNLVVNGDFEDATQNGICDDVLVFEDPSLPGYDPGYGGPYWHSVPEPCLDQHTLADITPSTDTNDAPVTITVTGTNLEFVTTAKLVSAAGTNCTNCSVIETTTVLPAAGGPNLTSLALDFDVTGAHVGRYTLLTTQDLPCFGAQLANEYELICPTPAFTVEPLFVTDPTGPTQLRIVGAGAADLPALALYMGLVGDEIEVIPGTDLTPDGDDLLATFDLSCAPRGTYSLSNCVTHRDFQIRRSLPEGAVIWQPWAAYWSRINNTDPETDDVDPDEFEEAYDAPNWHYDLAEVQSTVLNMTQDLPPGGGSNAFHWFLDEQVGSSNSFGSGAVYQEITVTPGVPLEYSFYWKGKAGDTESWFAFVLVDGPFSGFDGDAYPDNANGNSPFTFRRRELTSGSFAWEQVTDADLADHGPAGPRQQTLTPTGDIATVVFKAGALPASANGGVEMMVDLVSVSQNGGPNLLLNGGFEDFNQLNASGAQTVEQYACEDDFWLRSDYVLGPVLQCEDPKADADGDGDVDGDDFAEFQLCFGNFAHSDYCACLDALTGAPDGQTTLADYSAFSDCATGPGIPHATAPNPACAEQP